MNLTLLEKALSKAVKRNKRTHDGHQWNLTNDGKDVRLEILYGMDCGQTIFTFHDTHAQTKPYKNGIHEVFGQKSYTRFPLKSNTAYDDIAASMVHSALNDLESNIPTVQSNRAQSSLCR